VKTTAVVPVYISEASLAETLRRLNDVRNSVDLEILLIVDIPGPVREDEIKQEIGRLADAWDARPLYRIGVRGFGGALRLGFEQASGGAVVPVMGDGSDRPEDIPALVGRLNQGADVVGGSRFVAGGRIVGNTTKQRMSRLYSGIMRRVAGVPIHDVSNAFKLYRKSVVDGIDTVGQSFDISVELTVKAAIAGYRLDEIPTTWTNRREGVSLFSFRHEVTRYGRWLLLALRTRGRRASRAERSKWRARRHASDRDASIEAGK
jgi:dolichol-phosphate mannosyltransferase